VAQDKDLDILRGVGSGEQRQPVQDLGQHQVRESKGHGKRSCLLVAYWPEARTNGTGRQHEDTLVRALDAVLGTHKLGHRITSRARHHLRRAQDKRHRLSWISLLISGPG
jgi:hypothetical protein